MVVIGRTGLDGYTLKCFGQLLQCLHFPPMWAYGAAGSGCWREFMRSAAVTAAFSAKDRNVIVELCGNNSTVLGWKTARVCGRYMP